MAAVAAGLRAAALAADGADDAAPLERTAMQASEHFHAEALAHDRRLRVCFFCTPRGRVFQEIANVGRLECRYHPGSIVRGAFACCGQRLGVTASHNAYGCVPCDHVAFACEADVSGRHGAQRWTPETLTHRLPLHLLHLYAPDADLVVERSTRDERPERHWAAVLRVHPAHLDRRLDGIAGADGESGR